MSQATTRLILVRHGETAANAERRIQGHMNTPLNSIGLQQAERLADLLTERHLGCTDVREIGAAIMSSEITSSEIASSEIASSEIASSEIASSEISAVYCSDLIRTRQTLAPFVARTQCQVNYTERLRERHFGVFEGQILTEFALQEPARVARFHERDPLDDLDGGESMQVFFDRSHDALVEIASAHRGETVLVVTHGGVLDCVQRWARGLSLAQARDFKILNASVNQVTVQGQACKIQAWAQIDHLVLPGGAATRDDPSVRG